MSGKRVEARDMEPYSSFFYVGCAGLVFMALLGAVGGHGHHHGGHDAGGFHLHGTGGHGHGPSDAGFHHSPIPHSGAAHGHALGHSHAPGAGNTGHVSGHAGHGHSNQHAHSDARGQGRGSNNESGFNLRTAALSWVSPRVLLTLAMGIGATGMLVGSVLPVEPLRAFAALAGGVALEKLAVAPLWNLLTRFASTPARTLESAVLEEATALTGFDTSGCGLVSINLDGHEMRLLARLAPEHLQERVRSGDTLIVDSVDGARGQCVVSPLSQTINLP